jgi:hypothetical protein
MKLNLTPSQDGGFWLDFFYKDHRVSFCFAPDYIWVTRLQKDKERNCYNYRFQRFLDFRGFHDKTVD